MKGLGGRREGGREGEEGGGGTGVLHAVVVLPLPRRPREDGALFIHQSNFRWTMINRSSPRCQLWLKNVTPTPSTSTLTCSGQLVSPTTAIVFFAIPVLNASLSYPSISPNLLTEVRFLNHHYSWHIKIVFTPISKLQQLILKPTTRAHQVG